MSYRDRALALAPAYAWRLGDAASPLAAAAGGVPLTAVGTAFAVAGALPPGEDDGALGFGGGAYASAALDLSDATVLTLSMWLSWAAYGSDDALLLEHTANYNLNDGGFIVDPNNSTGGAEANTVSVGVHGPGGTSRVTFPRAALPAGEFHHLTLVLALSGTIKVYVDGEAVPVTVRDAGVPGGAGFANDVLSLMSRSEGSGLNGNGTLDELDVYKRELTAGEVADLVTEPPPSGPVLYVDADHGASSDAGNRAAAMNPATPLETVERALILAQVGDTVEVKPAANADPSNPLDSAVYARAFDDTAGGSVWPAKDATGAQVVIRGVQVGGVRPKWLGISGRDIKNWKITGFQLGYDVGSGDDKDTAASLLRIEDVVYEDCVFTGGGAGILGFTGHNLFDGCVIHSPLTETPGSFMEGVGFRILGDDGVDVVSGPDDEIKFLGCAFSNVQGEDAIQIVSAIGVGTIDVDRCSFDDIIQAGSAHTDAIQTTGVQKLRVANCTFGLTGRVDSMIIASDGNVGELELENNLFRGRPGLSGFATQFSGVHQWLIRHNTWVDSRFGGLRFFVNGNLPASYGGVIENNIIDKFSSDIPLAAGTGASTKRRNLIALGPVTIDDLRGFANFGTSPETSYELANSPTPSPGINAGIASSLLVDRLGRARSGAPDCGCHEANPGVAVAPIPRPPYVVATSPAGVDVPPDSVVEVVLYPKPGEAIDEATVTAATFYVRDPGGAHLPVASVVVGELDGDGQQTITLVVDGALYPYVDYVAVLADTIADTEASAMGLDTEWAFRVAGPDGPAVYPAGGPTTSAWTVGAVAA